MLIDLNMNPSPQGGFIVAQDRSFLKPRRSGKCGTSKIVSFEHAKASAALAASCKRACGYQGLLIGQKRASGRSPRSRLELSRWCDGRYRVSWGQQFWRWVI